MRILSEKTNLLKMPKRKNSQTVAISKRRKSIRKLFDIIPDEIVVKIFEYLHIDDIYNVNIVSRRFNTVSNDIQLWESLAGKHMPFFNSIIFNFDRY